MSDVKKEKTLKATKLTAEQKAALHNNLELDSVPAWNPETNAELFGVVEDITLKTFKNERGTQQLNLAVIENDGVYSGVWLSTVLQSKFDELNIQPGDVVGIRYKGKKKNYHDYSVTKI